MTGRMTGAPSRSVETSPLARSLWMTNDTGDDPYPLDDPCEVRSARQVRSTDSAAGRQLGYAGDLPGPSGRQIPADRE